MNDIDLLLADIEAGPQGPQIGAFFDFDGTLIDGYSGVLAFRDRLTKGQVSPAELLGTLVEAFNMQAFGHDVDRLMRLAVKAFEGQPLEEIEKLSEELWRTRIAPRVYPDARRLVAAHLAAGHTVALASSATRFQAKSAAADLGIENLLVTEIESADGLLTGNVDGPILWGIGKADAVRRFADERGLDLTDSYAYGNGAEDILYLETVGRPRPLNPDSGLTAACAARDWSTFRLEKNPLLTPANVVRSAAAFAGIGVGVYAGLAAGLVNRSRRTALGVTSTIGSELALAAAGISIEVVGEDHLWSQRPAVFIFNHQSQLDVIVMGNLMRRDFTGVAKHELRHDPVFAPLGWLADVAYIDRTDNAAARKALEPALKALEEGRSLAIAPEGTRSPSVNVLPFKKGAFHLAMQAEVPIVPVVIRNAGELMPAHAMVMRPGVVEVAVLEPIDTSTWTPANLSEQVERVRELYVETLRVWPS